ncbi:MAG: NAD(P)H-hydrate dehydratase [Candidatus Melainabacteria bacterium]|nr:NAD(P)H-hydrate dehydratase [Candidatus Melainabacteria bacterium]
MIPVLTRSEFSQLDKRAAEASSGFEYMQKAARGLFDLIISRYLDLQKQGRKTMVVVFAGTGNNGGDGLLAAAYLAEQGYPVTVFATGDASQYQNEALLAYQELEQQKLSPCFINDVADIEFVQEQFKEFTGKFDRYIFVDALLGFGASGETREPAATLIRFINENYPMVETIAVDLPSGTDADNGKLNGTAVRAHKTLSMGYPKLGSFFFPARANYGLTIVQNLNYPQEIFEQEFKSQVYFASSIKQLMPPRVATGSKYDHGYAALWAGSPGMEGALKLAASAAYKSGLGLLKVITDQETRKIFATSFAEAISAEFDDGILTSLIAPQDDKKTPAVLALGPGLGEQKQIKTLLENYQAPMVLDADGINSLDLDLLAKHQGEVLLTPHAGEYSRLFGELKPGLEPIDLVQELQAQAQKYKVSILFKGSPTIIADPGGKVFVVPFGNSGLATAGSGDVLTGLITGLSAQIYTVQARHPNLRFFYQACEISALTQAAILGAYLHAKAGEAAAKQLSEYSVMASDLLDYIPAVILREGVA